MLGFLFFKKTELVMPYKHCVRLFRLINDRHAYEGATHTSLVVSSGLLATITVILIPFCPTYILKTLLLLLIDFAILL